MPLAPSPGDSQAPLSAVESTNGTHAHPSRYSSLSPSPLPGVPPSTAQTERKRRRREDGAAAMSPPDTDRPEESSHQRQRLNDGSRKSRSTGPLDTHGSAATESSRDHALRHASDVEPSASRHPSHPSRMPSDHQRLVPEHAPQTNLPSPSPSRTRRPPVSQSAWSALRERIGAPSSSSTWSRPPQLAGGRGRLPPGPAHADNRRTQATDIFSRFAGRALSDIASGSSLNSAAAGDSLQSSSRPHPSRWGPGAVVAALMSDILGFSTRTGLAPVSSPAGLPPVGLGAPPLSSALHQGPSNATSPDVTAPLSASELPPSLPSEVPYQRTRPNIPPRPSPLQSQSAPHAGAQSTATEGLRLFPFGGTSIIVQGAMIARLSRGGEEEGRGREGEGLAASQESTRELHNDAPESQSRGRTSMGDPSNIATGSNVPAWGDAQANMLSRLLSIAAAATAASLTSGPPTRPTGARQEASSAAAPFTGHTSPHHAEASMDTLESSVNLPEEAGHRRSVVRSVLRTSLGSEDANYYSRGRFRRLIASLMSRILGRPSSHQTREESMFSRGFSSHNTTRGPESDQTDTEADEVDSSLGTGSLSRPIAPVETETENETENPRGRGEQTDNDSRSALSMSEMLQEAIRDGVVAGSSAAYGTALASEEGALTSPTNDEDSAMPSVTPQPLPDYLRGVLSAVRENRLRRGSEGSFERWLFDMNEDLDHAVRRLTTLHQGLTPGVTRTQAGSVIDTDESSAFDGENSDRGIHDRRAGDVEEGQLSFFRLFRFDGRGLEQQVSDGRTTTLHQTTQSNSSGSGASPENTLPNAGRLVPCVVVGVRSLSLASEPVTPRNAGDRFRTLLSRAPIRPQSGRLREQNTQTYRMAPSERDYHHTMNGSPTSQATTPPAGLDVTASTEIAPSSNPNDPNDSSRFLLFVSGGHYPPSHPLLSTPSNVAARDLMILIEVLSNLNGASTASGNGRVTKEELEAHAPSVRTWQNIKVGVVDVDAKEGTTTNEGGTDQLALRAGDRCAVCLEEWSDEDAVRILGCRHTFHQGCVDQWLLESSNSCPMCRQVAVKKRGMSAEDNDATGRSGHTRGSVEQVGHS